MPGNRQQYKRALEKWDSLHEAGSYSVPESVGEVAILFSCFDYANKKADIDEFEAEAYDIDEIVTSGGHRSIVIPIRNSEAIDTAIADPWISTIVAIGHGALSYIYSNNNAHGRKDNNRYDWLDASRASTHLKTGHFVQRHCGNETRLLSVPLGTFVMASHASVRAPVGSDFTPASLDDVENKLIRPVCQEDRLSYDCIKKYFDNTNFLQGWLGEVLEN